MKRRVSSILLTISIMAVTLSVGCTADEEIRENVVDSLIQVNLVAIDEMDSELEEIDQELYIIEQKLMKLDQVIAPALEWIEIQKPKMMEEHTTGSWRTQVSQEGLTMLKNDQYQVTVLKFEAREIGTRDEKLSTVIKITDLTASMKTQLDWETVYDELEQQKSTLEQQTQAKLENRQLCTSTLLRVIQYWEDWDIQEINGTTYSISGPGLGIDGELTTGRWTYHTNSQELTPADTQGSALKKILLGEF